MSSKSGGTHKKGGVDSRDTRESQWENGALNTLLVRGGASVGGNSCERIMAAGAGKGGGGTQQLAINP